MMAVSTDCILFCCFLFFITTFLLIKSIKTHSNPASKVQTPPSPPALPIIGHVHLLGAVLAKSLHSLAHRYGPFMQLRLGASTLCYVVSDASLAKEILKTNEMNFVSRLEFDTSDYNIYRGFGFITAPYDTYWRFMKKLCMTRLLAPSQLKQLTHVREQEIMKLVESLINISNEGGYCHVKQVLMTTTNNVICRMAMSTRCTENANEANEILELATQAVVLGGKLNLGNVLGPLAKLDLFGYGRGLRRVLQRFDQLVERIIKEHEDHQDNRRSSEAKDLMDILLETCKDPNAEMMLTRKDIKAFFLDIIMAGTDTSALTVQWVLGELLNHPDVFKKLREEIDSVVGPNRRLVKESDISNLPYLQAVVKETLRLHPPAPVVLRECMEDCKINGFDLKGKTRMLVNLYTIQRDPNLWMDPEDFIPERFMLVNNNNINSNNQGVQLVEMKGQNFNYFPFGSGRRACPGAGLAVTMIQATVGALVQCFDWKIKDRDTVDMQEGSGFSMGMLHPLLCYPFARFNPFHQK